MTTDFPSPWQDLLDAAARRQLKIATARAESELSAGKKIFPPRPRWFAAFQQLAPQDVRAVILGQDPYPTAGNAMGLAFSVPRGVAIPASLRNIYIGLKNDLGVAAPAHGDLSAWTARGVLLLNSVLTVEEGRPNAHAAFGWQAFTDAVIAALGSGASPPKAFLLWGAHAQKKASLIDGAQHLVLESPHPSPLSARRGFFDNRHFSKANAFLQARHLPPIDWTLPA